MSNPWTCGCPPWPAEQPFHAYQPGARLSVALLACLHRSLLEGGRYLTMLRVTTYIPKSSHCQAQSRVWQILFKDLTCMRHV